MPWKTLWKSIRNTNCRECSISEEANSVCLIGQGPVPADLMIVGEAPGRREDDIAKPFSGLSGELLEDMLNEVGIGRDEVFITNVVKCRPPDNRTPSLAEIKACLPYLWEEVRAVKPKFILLLGNTALRGVIGKVGIKKNRGIWYEVEGINILSTYHPSAILRNPGLTNPYKADFVKLASGMNQGITNEINIHYESVKGTEGLKRALKACRDAKILTYDLEYKDELVLTMSFYMQMKDGTEKGFFIPLGHPQSRFKKKWVEIMKLFVPVIEKRPPYEHLYITGQNIKADNKHFMRLFDAKPKPDFDTMNASHITDENTPNSLAYLSQVFANANNYKEEVDRANLEEEDFTKVEKYNITDAYYHLKVYYALAKLVDEDPRIKLIFENITMTAVKGFSEAEVRGLWMDPKKIRRMTVVTRKRVVELLNKMSKFLPPDKDINWNSPQQVAWVLYEHLGLDIIKYTATGKPSTAEGCLVYLEHPLVSLLLQYRSQMKLLGTYLASWAEKIDENNRLHTSFKIHGTVTGRVSSEKPNIMNIPRDSDIRSVVSAPPGWVFVEADYSQIELRIVAHMAYERTMLRIFQTKGDIHTETAMSVTGKRREEVTKEDRKRAKAVNFGFVYGMSANKFRSYAKEKYGVDLTETEAVEFRRNFFRKYKDLKPWHDKQRRIVKRLGYVRSVLGRKRRLPDIKSREEGIRAEAERQAINSPVQAVPPDLSFLALKLLMEKPGWGKEIFFVSQVHDALQFEIREDKFEKWAPIIKEVMEKPPLKELFGVELLVPIEVEIKYGPWGKGVVWSE